MKQRILLKSAFLVFCVVVGMLVFAYLHSSEIHAASNLLLENESGESKIWLG